MKTRIVSGIIAAAVLIGVLYYGSSVVVQLAVLALATIAYLEFDGLFFGEKSLARQIRMVLLIGTSILLIRHPSEESLGFLSIWICWAVIGMSNVILANRHGDFKKAVRETTMEWFGYSYILALFGFILPIFELTPDGRSLLILFLFIVFLGDTMAYFVGSRFGKNRLAEKVSPKKSVEGSVAAVITSILVTLVWLSLHSEFQIPPVPTRLLILAPIVSMLAQFGDLLESLFKRSEAKKDSGKFMPGHGGVLDRIDGMGLAAPIFYFYLIHQVVGQ